MLKQSRKVTLAKNSLGKEGEDYAVKLLTAKGYKILERNFGTKLVEADLIAVSGDALVFLEVKTRASTRMGQPYEAVRREKIAKLTQLGQAYQAANPKLPAKMRIEVLSLIKLPDGSFQTQLLAIN